VLDVVDEETWAWDEIELSLSDEELEVAFTKIDETDDALTDRLSVELAMELEEELARPTELDAIAGTLPTLTA
jgi:hypothetical protein